MARTPQEKPIERKLPRRRRILVRCVRALGWLALVVVCLGTSTAGILIVACRPRIMIHIPKTGGTAVTFALARLGIIAGAASEAICSPLGLGLNDVDIPRNWNDLRKHHVPRRFWKTPPAQQTASFCVVRDPFERTLSELKFRFPKVLQERNCDKNMLHRLVRQQLRMAHISMKHQHYHWVPQVMHAFSDDGTLLCEDALCFEDVFGPGKDLETNLVELSPALWRESSSIRSQISAVPLRIAVMVIHLWGRFWADDDVESNASRSCTTGATAGRLDDTRLVFNNETRKLLAAVYQQDIAFRRCMGCRQGMPEHIFAINQSSDASCFRLDARSWSRGSH